jgi:hypothetical protein
MSILINASQTSRPLLKGQGWNEIDAKRFQRFKEVCFLTKADDFMHCALGTNVAVSFVMKDDLETLGVAVHAYGSFYSVFLTENVDVARELANDLIKFKGATNQSEYDLVIQNKEADRNLCAQKVYESEAIHFGECSYVQKVFNKSGFFNSDELNSITQSNTSTTKFLNQIEAIDLVKKVANDFSLQNVELRFDSNLSELVMGRAGPLQDDFAYSTGKGVYVDLNPKHLYFHVVLHEMAHAIDIYVNKYTNHSNNWKNIYNDLLVNYTGGDRIVWLELRN